MEFKGTKGEWKVLDEFRNVKILNKSNQPMFQSDINCFDDENGMHKYYSHNKIMSNAQLIATAPELLKDAIDLLWLVKNHATHEEIQERVYETEKTINKALGK